MMKKFLFVASLILSVAAFAAEQKSEAAVELQPLTQTEMAEVQAGSPVVECETCGVSESGMICRNCTITFPGDDEK